MSIRTRRLPSTSLVRHPPTRETDNVNRQKSQSIADPRLRAGVDLVVGSLVVGV